jgi:acyl phosphate:glycerol-3-phosphate acyltransferase
MISVTSPWWIVIVAYLLGSIPFGFLIVKLTRRGDIRAQGSGNIGAANVSRQAGAGAGVATLVLDAAKGYVAVWLAARVSGANVRWMILSAAAAVMGHVFSVWLRFHGGKGVATGLGVFLVICPAAVAAAFVVWILVVAFWHYSSLGSITAAAALPILVYLLYAPPHTPPLALSAGTVVVSLLVLWKHRENMRRLLDGTENKLKFGR